MLSSILSSRFSVSSLKQLGRRRLGNGSPLVVSALGEDNSVSTLTGLVFQPFEKVKSDIFVVSTSANVSLARQSVEYNVSYVYHSLFAYFDRDNIALKGLAKFFKESSEEEREHAEKLMKYQNMRGGKVKLYSILMSPSDFENAEKGDALYGEFWKTKRKEYCFN